MLEIIGGPDRDRTDDLFHAMEARSQLRHRPTCCGDATLPLSPLGRDSSNPGFNWRCSVIAVWNEGSARLQRKGGSVDEMLQGTAGRAERRGELSGFGKRTDGRLRGGARENAMTGNIAGVFRCLRECGRGTLGHRPGSVSRTPSGSIGVPGGGSIGVGMGGRNRHWGLGVRVHEPAVRMMKAKSDFEMTDVLLLR